MAIGAQRSQVFRQVAMGGLKLVTGGICLGLLASVALTRVLSGMLFTVRPLDWSVFLAVAVLLLVIGFAALAVPAWNASRLSRSQSLRWE
jgi:ABC-type antimicrobial peptide transport system permease subunit